MNSRILEFSNAFVGGLLLVLIGFPVEATQVGGVRFDKQCIVADRALEIKGAGILRYMGVVKVYAGALYALPGLDAEAVLEDTPKRLEVQYFIALKGEDFGTATYKGLSRNLSEKKIHRLRERIDYHNSLYVDVRPGDRYALTYAPGKGTELSLNGRALGVIQGADFASAVFSMWLGDNPLDRHFKKALMGMDG